MNPANPSFDPARITQPDERLMKYYFIISLLSFVGFPITLITLWIRFRTMRYRFDDEGVWRKQGLLWRREVNVAYRRIQDIHLTNNIIQRWLGLAKVSIQTAAGSAAPVITIEGVLEAEALRDFLYTKMRGVKDTGPGPRTDAYREALPLLGDIRDSLRRLEDRLGKTGSGA